MPEAEATLVAIRIVAATVNAAEAGRDDDIGRVADGCRRL
jgi:hypothetical protein